MKEYCDFEGGLFFWAKAAHRDEVFMSITGQITAAPVVRTVSPTDLHRLIEQGRRVQVIDVRTPIEFAGVHAAPARLVPLAELMPQSFPGDEPVYFICKSGKRATQACEKLLSAGRENVACVEGGTDAWVRAGLPVVRRPVMSLERQVRIAAGSLVLLAVALGYLIHTGFFAIAGFVGAGLVFAGITDFCGMGLLIARAPWNRHATGT